MNREKLILELQKRGVSCSEEQSFELEKYMHYVLDWNEKMNLTAIKDEEAFYEKMIFDSAIALIELDLTNKKVIDIGTGAGFPGVVLYLLNPNMDLTLLDSTTKKVELLKHYALTNGLKYKTVSQRAEDFAQTNKEQFDYVFARAVAPLNVLIELCTPLLKIGGTFIALKGPGFEDELNDSDGALKKLCCHVQKVIVDVLPECGESRNIIYIVKDKITPKKYPRRYDEIKKNQL